MIHLEPCPFCGHDLERNDRKRNPYARCVTPDCMGGKLPLISLDLPEDIERWNRRALARDALAAHVERLHSKIDECYGDPERMHLEAGEIRDQGPITFLVCHDAQRQIEILERLYETAPECSFCGWWGEAEKLIAELHRAAEEVGK